MFFYFPLQEIAGVGYSNETTAITVGTYGNIIKWNITANLAKTYQSMMKNFKPTCMACSKHLPLHVAIGTKQGVVFVMDLNSKYLTKSIYLIIIITCESFTYYTFTFWNYPIVKLCKAGCIL